MVLHCNWKVDEFVGGGGEGASCNANGIGFRSNWCLVGWKLEQQVVALVVCFGFRCETLQCYRMYCTAIRKRCFECCNQRSFHFHLFLFRQRVFEQQLSVVSKCNWVVFLRLSLRALATVKYTLIISVKEKLTAIFVSCVAAVIKFIIYLVAEWQRRRLVQRTGGGVCGCEILNNGKINN